MVSQGSDTKQRKPLTTAVTQGVAVWVKEQHGLGYQNNRVLQFM